ncbi:MAG TPA: AI-2E family transporter [Aliidongia sp.]|nr:AI-2E family transporter [Aliidongia sp.]
MDRSEPIKAAGQPKMDDLAPESPADEGVEEGARDLPLPSDPKTVFLGGLFVIAVLVVCNLAIDIVLPVVCAFVLKLLLQPAVRGLERLWVPRPLAALASVAMLVGLLVGLGTLISGPASSWVSKLPDAVPRLEQRLSVLRRPIQIVDDQIKQIESFGNMPAPSNGSTVMVEHSSRAEETLFSGTRAALGTLLTSLLFLFFLLVSGETFLRRMVEILPRFRDKRQVVDIVQQIERDISAYLVTVTAMNALVGIATGLLTWAVGLDDPLLWGFVAFLLNYLPILGPSVGVGLFLLIGLLSFDSVWHACVPAAGYLAIHLVEGEAVTPMLLARRFTLNPVIVMFSIVFWYWMWGVPGAIIAVPMVAICKIVCDGIRGLSAFGHFLGGNA